MDAPTTLYALILRWPYEDAETYGIYTTEAKAWEAAEHENLKDTLRTGADVEVESFVLDAPPTR